MNPFARQIAFFDSLQNDIFSTIAEVFRSRGFIIEEKIRNDQLYNRGVDGNEKRLKGYTRITIRRKIAKGQPADRTTLRDENKFHPSIKIKVFADRIEISSDVNHAKYLVGRYGLDIMKPTSENLNNFITSEIIPALKRRINGKLTR